MNRGKGLSIRVALWVVILVAMVFSAQAQTAFVCAVRKGEWVWVRAAPDREAAGVGTIRYGVEGEIHEIRNGYARITTESGQSGWVDVSYLDMPIRERVYTITAEGPVNKRETPDGRFMTRIKAGARISVLGWRYSKKGELWARVFRGGYVKAMYLQEVE
ncbi:MAG: SH3 domain-containing protein [Clostridia bacterium]|nr:SH3 domain-containing protein [Clostridia bacterium]